MRPIAIWQWYVGEDVLAVYREERGEGREWICANPATPYILEPLTPEKGALLESLGYRRMGADAFRARFPREYDRARAAFAAALDAPDDWFPEPEPPVWYATTYSTLLGDHLAYQLPWAVVEAILGHPHRGIPEDDDRLLRWLAQADVVVPEGVGWIDEFGWGIYDPTPLPPAL